MRTSELKKQLETFISYLNGKIQTPKGLKSMYKYRVVDYGKRVSVERKFEQGTSETWFEIDKGSRMLLGIDVDTTVMVDEMDFYDYMTLFGIVSAYFNTPLEERGEEQRWYLHLSRGGSEYLNQDKETGAYELDTKYEIIDCKTEFTRSEIEEWAGTSNDEVIDWIIGKFGEGVE